MAWAYWLLFTRDLKVVWYRQFWKLGKLFYSDYFWHLKFVMFTRIWLVGNVFSGIKDDSHCVRWLILISLTAHVGRTGIHWHIVNDGKFNFLHYGRQCTISLSWFVLLFILTTIFSEYSLEKIWFRAGSLFLPIPSCLHKLGQEIEVACVP